MLLGLDEVMRVGPHDENSVIRRGRDQHAPACALECSLSPPSLFEDPVRRQGTELAGILILDFPVPRTVGNKFRLFKPPSLMVFCYSSLIQSKFIHADGM